MKTILKTLLLILSISLVSCKKEEMDKRPRPISTLEVTEITSTSAICGGEMDVYTIMGYRGICWSTNPNPTENDSRAYDTTYGEASFSCIMTNLTPNTKYYVRAFHTTYITNYGEQMEFTTLAE